MRVANKGAIASGGRIARRTPALIRDLIMTAAGEEFEALGQARATTAGIARRAGVTEAQIFRYFGSKAALFRAAIFEPLGRHFAEFQARGDADGADLATRTRQYVTELSVFMETHSRMLLSLVVAGAYDPDGAAGLAGLAGLGGYFAQGAALMRHRIADTPGAAGTDPEVMVRVSFAALLGTSLLGEWMFPPGLADEMAIREAVIDFVIGGLSAGKGGVR